MKKFLSVSGVLITVLLTVHMKMYGKEVNMKYFGAKGDGKNLDTESINRAIRTCKEDGGGTVIFPAGTYLTGSIRLFSNINLHLEAGAKILASPNLEDYDEMEGFQSEGRTTCLIFAAFQENISISGNGMIVGNDSAYIDWQKLHPECCFTPAKTRQGLTYQNSFPDGPAAVIGNQNNRPGALITFIECNNIDISDIQIVGAPNWCLHLACCHFVKLTELLINNSLMIPNAGAVDISKCSAVTISDCILIAGDDGIAIGTCADGYCRRTAENIVVSNCYIESRSAGIRIGWSNDNIRNCTFQNLVIVSNRGIGIFVRHDEVVENLIFSDLVLKTRLHTGWWGNGEPVHLSQIPLGELHGLSSSGKKPGMIRNIQFNNIVIEAEHGNVIYGYDPASISDIFFNNIQMTLKNSLLNDKYGGNFDLRPAFNNDYGIFKHDIPGLFSKNCNNLIINGFVLKMERGLPDFITHGIHCEDFENLTLNNYRFYAPGNYGFASVFLRNGSGIDIGKIVTSKGIKKIVKEKINSNY